MNFHFRFASDRRLEWKPKMHPRSSKLFSCEGWIWSVSKVEIESLSVSPVNETSRSNQIIVRIKNPGLEVYISISLWITKVKNRFAQFSITLPNTPLGIGSLFNHMIKKWAKHEAIYVPGGPKITSDVYWLLETE